MAYRMLICILLLSFNLSADVIFEDDFSGFTESWVTSGAPGHQVIGGTTESPGAQVPTGWTGYIDHHSGNYLGIVTGEGRGDTSCLKIGQEPGHSPSEQVGLIKYLGATGYTELYIRYYVKYDNDYRWGDGTNSSLAYHKWLRIWQNVPVAEIVGTEGNLADEHNRGFVLITTTDDAYDSFDPTFNLTCSQDPTKNSVELSYTTANYYPWVDNTNQGHVENIFGEIDATGYWVDTQAWHCLEFRFKLSTGLLAGDGVFEWWADGVKQVSPTFVSHREGEVTGTFPTPVYGTGMNYIGIHDNATGSQEWVTTKYTWIDDVVISTEYIGTDYIIGKNQSSGIGKGTSATMGAGTSSVFN